MKSINEYVQAAHSNAVSKGWWDPEPSFGEVISLIHSEVSEALEDFRNGKQPTEVWYEADDGNHTVQWNDSRKPCGIPSELADIVIRVFDACGRCGWGEALEAWCSKAIPEPGCAVDEERSLAENLNIIHGNLTDCSRAESWQAFKFAIVVQNVEKLAGFYDIDLEQAIREKMAYNATRPQRHGGKKL
ncbi:hypothetical protein P4H66_06315 [Paenibacillus dokdonensis]|uniref:Uncharacterized protein n=1 Tax=Paenibacillus dokdonensis TaxID=2567944 RepID=A0ABU6GI98_9BACL|nr:hypothetical protein [Paenibacillus dokdonensis]MEC0239469.1 hypothetical protein [Paenibacillus dokdonensis]